MQRRYVSIRVKQKIMKIAVLQSSYIPWKGYFDVIHDVDLFIFCDDVQFTKGDWRSRNKIKTPNGTLWLTVPAGSKLNRLVCEVELLEDTWADMVTCQVLAQCFVVFLFDLL